MSVIKFGNIHTLGGIQDLDLNDPAAFPELEVDILGKVFIRNLVCPLIR